MNGEDVDVPRVAAVLAGAFRPPQLTPAARSLLVHGVRLLVRGKPVSTEDLAAASGRAPADVREAVSALEGHGLLLRDREGRWVGALGLSLQPTRHGFRVAGRQLYTWCALDALFLPIVLDRRAAVESACPASGAPVRAAVTPRSLESIDPPEAVVSVVVPGLSAGLADRCGPGACDPGGEPAVNAAGPESSFCSQVHFFRSREAGAGWLAERPGALLLTAGEAYELGRVALAAPLLEIPST